MNTIIDMRLVLFQGRFCSTAMCLTNHQTSYLVTLISYLTLTIFRYYISPSLLYFAVHIHQA